MLLVQEVGDDANMIYLCNVISCQKQICLKIVMLQNGKENAKLSTTFWQAKSFKHDM